MGTYRMYTSFRFWNAALTEVRSVVNNGTPGMTRVRRFDVGVCVSQYMSTIYTLETCRESALVAPTRQSFC